MVAVIFSFAACSDSSKIETIEQAFDLVIDSLSEKYFDGENCLSLVMELSEEAGREGGPSIWWNTGLSEGGEINYYTIVRSFDRPGAHTEFGMQWHVYPDGRIEAQHKYPPC
jgi:hypothetical protein